jgi:hypothetical protein
MTVLAGALLATTAACQPMITVNQRVEFIDQEPGIDPDLIRMTANAQYLRIEEGGSANGYILFDRQKKIILSINDSSRTIMLIAPPPSNLQPPFALTHTVKELGALPDAPKIHNITPIHHQFLTNAKVCMDVISVPGLLPEMIQALREYQLILATDSARTFNQTPADMQDPCEIARSTFSPVREYTYGFPIREWRPSGYIRALKDYKETIDVADDYFQVPKDYFTYTVQQLRDGVVDLDNRKILAPAPVQAQK